MMLAVITKRDCFCGENMPREKYTSRDADKDNGSFVYAESHTGESNRKKKNRSNTQRNILFSQRQKNKKAAQNTNKTQCVHKCAFRPLCVLYVCA